MLNDDVGREGTHCMVLWTTGQLLVLIGSDQAIIKSKKAWSAVRSNDAVLNTDGPSSTEAGTTAAAFSLTEAQKAEARDVECTFILHGVGQVPYASIALPRRTLGDFGRCCMNIMRLTVRSAKQVCIRNWQD